MSAVTRACSGTKLVRPARETVRGKGGQWWSDTHLHRNGRSQTGSHLIACPNPRSNRPTWLKAVQHHHIREEDSSWVLNLYGVRSVTARATHTTTTCPSPVSTSHVFAYPWARAWYSRICIIAQALPLDAHATRYSSLMPSWVKLKSHSVISYIAPLTPWPVLWSLRKVRGSAVP